MAGGRSKHRWRPNSYLKSLISLNTRLGFPTLQFGFCCFCLGFRCAWIWISDRRLGKRCAHALELFRMCALASARSREPVGAGGQTDGFMELAGERRLIGVAAFERQLAQGGLGMPEAVARPADAQPGQILAGREAEQGP